MHSPDSTHYSELRTALHGLSPSGPDGFEGLLKELLSALTGRRFFLASSGYQQGRDLSTGGLGGTWIAVEAKRYGTKTHFDETHLLGKIYQVTLGKPRPDLWVLAASSEPHEQVISRLRTAGLREGLEVEVLVSPSGEPGDLDFLCASAPEITQRYLSDNLTISIESLREHPAYATAVRSLKERFCRPVMGFDHARNSALCWLREGLETPDEARGRLGQPLAVLSPTSHFIKRKSAANILRSWWKAWHHEHQPFILLGEEGVGKTWVTADWAYSAVLESETTIPVFMSSRDINSTEPQQLLSSYLAKVTATSRDIDWPPRLESWLARSRGKSALFLLILDGINERPSFAWRDLFDQLRTEIWRETVAVVITCRPGYWHSPNFMPEKTIKEWELDDFNDEELDEALSRWGRDRSDFVRDLVPLLRKPRYLSLAVRHYARLEETGDFTIDRLLYEDWKDRMQKKRGLMSDEAFRSLLAGLAERHREGRSRFSRTDLEKLLPRDQAQSLHELQTGGLLVVEKGVRHRYKVERRWLVHGLGLILADQLNQGVSRPQIEEELAHFLEPQLEIDQQSEIIGAAVLYALSTPDYSRPAKQALLQAWTSRQNHTATSVERLQAYVPIAIRDYLTVLEESTLNRHLDHRAVERLEYAVLPWRTLGHVETELVEYATRWLSFVHPRGFPYMRTANAQKGGQPERRQAAESALQKEIEERAGNPLDPGREVRLPGDYLLQVTDSDRFSWLADSALFCLSALPKRFLLTPLKKWALSRAVIGHAKERGQVAWLLRESAEREFEGQLLQAVDQLLESDSLTLKRGGAELLSCLGSTRAAKRLTGLPEEARGIFRTTTRVDNESSDPCLSPSRQWSHDDCSTCAERSDLSDLLVIAKLASHCLDPNFQLPAVAVNRSLKALEAISLSNVWRSYGRTSSEGDLERIELTVAVADPQRLVGAYRTIIRTQFLDEVNWQATAHRLENFSLLLERKREKATLIKRWKECLETGPSEETQLVHWESDIFKAVIHFMTPREQLRAFISRPPWTLDSIEFLACFKELDQKSLSVLLASLAESSGKDLERKLAFLLAQETIVLNADNERTLSGLLDLRDSKPEVYLLLSQVILRFGSEDLWWKALSEGKIEKSTVIFFRQRWPYEQSFLGFSTTMPYNSLRERIDLATLSYLLDAGDRTGQDLSLYAADLTTAIKTEHTKQSDPLNPLFEVGFSVPYIRALLSQHAHLASEWIEIAMQINSSPAGTNFLKSAWPLYEALCEALFIEQDPRASSLYEVLNIVQRSKDSFLRESVGGDLPLLLLRIDSRAVYPHIEEWYKACWRDINLLDFATAVRHDNRESFLFDLVRRDLESPSYLDRARALSLTGWCGEIFEMDSLVENLTTASDSWFEFLKRQALRRRRHEGWARAWLFTFLTSRSLADSFAAFRLLLRLVDRRYYVWRKEIYAGTPSRPSATRQRRMRFLKTNHREIEDAIKRNEKDLDSHFLGLRIPRERQSPWTALPTLRSHPREGTESGGKA